MLHVGQKVTLIREETSWVCPCGCGKPPPAAPVFGAVYTVAEIVTELWGRPIRPHIVLAELHDCDCWEARLFRPVTDISVFTAMLNRAPVPETEDA